MSSLPETAGPDGAPFGLYVYDSETTDIITNARLVYWIIGSPENLTWTSLPGHSNCWSSPFTGTLAQKSDGLYYTPYTFTYTCPIDPTQAVIDSDGVKRLYLGDFHVRASFRQLGSLCDNVTYWTQRFITINGEEFTFERRNGVLGPASQQRALRAAPMATDDGSALPT